MRSLILIGIAFLLVGTMIFSSTSPTPAESIRHQGVCWVGGREKISEKELRRISDLRVNWISQTPFGWQAKPDAPEIKFRTSGEKMWWGESDEGIAETARLGHALNIKTQLKPHVWAKNWPGDIAMTNDGDWAAWFSFYENFILHYANLAEKNHIDLLCIGTELQKTTSHEKEWRALIRKIRTVYHGPLTYAANFHQEFETIAFWNDLDFIGVQAYFPLTKSKDATVGELVNGWEKPLKAIETIQRRYNKPVLFTEIGYRSTHDAGVEPWRWPSAVDIPDACNEAQASCYQAFFKAAWNKKWLAGVYFWKWYPHGPHHMGEVDFTPQEKLAEKVMLENFSR